MEPVNFVEPKPGYLEKVKDLAQRQPKGDMVPAEGVAAAVRKILGA